MFRSKPHAGGQLRRYWSNDPDESSQIVSLCTQRCARLRGRCFGFGSLEFPFSNCAACRESVSSQATGVLSILTTHRANCRHLDSRSARTWIFRSKHRVNDIKPGVPSFSIGGAHYRSCGEPTAESSLIRRIWKRSRVPASSTERCSTRRNQ